jgi:hypothetical protein
VSLALGTFRVPIEVAVASPLAPAPDLPPTGRTETVTWRGVAGSTGARLSASTVTVTPDTVGIGRSLGVVATAKKAVTEIVVTSPEPGAPARALRIPDLRRHEGDTTIRVTGPADLPGSHHLVVTPLDGPVVAPLVAVPPLPARNALPEQLTGGLLSGSLLTLPDVAGRRLRVTLVKGDAPEDFVTQTISHGDVTLFAAPMPVGLHVDGPDGGELFALAGPLRSPASVDVTAALARHLDAAFAAGAAAPVTAGVTLRCDAVGRAQVAWSTEGELIERKVPGRLGVEVTGSPAVVPLPSPHPGRAAARTVADVTVRHHGMAIHPLSDPVPTADGGLGGPTVRDTAVRRSLPPGALRGLTIRRIGVVGWARGTTDLTLEVLGTPTTVRDLTPPVGPQPPAVVWFHLPGLPVDGPVELRLTATRGAFGWVAALEPLVRIAVATAPEGQRVTVGGLVLTLAGEETVATGAALLGTDGWTVSTDQFCTVSLARAVMEFPP